jgi:uncharacterized Tic20 family protein
MDTIPPATPSTSSQVRTWCVLCHASALLGLFFHFLGHLLGPLIVWLLKRGDSSEIDAHGKESLNFQLSMLIYDVVAGILCFVIIGFPLLVILWIVNTVLVIIASIRASEGQFYRYPFTIRFFN